MLSWTKSSIRPRPATSPSSRRRLEPRSSVERSRRRSGTAAPVSSARPSSNSGGRSMLHSRPPPLRANASSRTRVVRPRDAGLDDPLGAQVPRQAPREAAQANVGVIPAAEGAATHPQPAAGEVGSDRVPHALEPLLLLARPLGGEQVVNAPRRARSPGTARVAGADRAARRAARACARRPGRAGPRSPWPRGRRIRRGRTTGSSASPRSSSTSREYRAEAETCRPFAGVSSDRVGGDHGSPGPRAGSDARSGGGRDVVVRRRGLPGGAPDGEAARRGGLLHAHGGR